jgi:hypothetical protein
VHCSIGSQPPGFSGFLDQPRRSRKKRLASPTGGGSGELAGEYRRILKGANWLLTTNPRYASTSSHHRHRHAAKRHKRMTMFELFPGNYRSSYNTWAALAAGGEFGDHRLRASGGRDEVCMKPGLGWRICLSGGPKRTCRWGPSAARARTIFLQAFITRLLSNSFRRLIRSACNPTVAHGGWPGLSVYTAPNVRVAASQIPAPSARARRITAFDSRESSKSNLQGNRPPTAKNRQIRLLERAQSSSPFSGF